MGFEDVPVEVQQKIVNTRRVFEFYQYINVHEKYLKGRVVLTAQFDSKSRPLGVTVHFRNPRRQLFRGNAIRYYDGVWLELHGIRVRDYQNPL